VPHNFKSNLSSAIAQMFTKFDITGTAHDIELSPLIIPTTSMDLLMEITETKRVVLTGISATGAQTLFTVPAKQRWSVYNYSWDRLSGDATFDNVSLMSVGVPTVIERFTAAASHSGHGYPTWTLEPGNSIRVYCNAVSSTSSFEATLWITRAKAY